MTPLLDRPGRRRGCLALGALCALWAAAPCLSPPAAAQVAEAHELKAAFLYNFTKFVEWPAETFPERGSRFRICVVGDEPLAGFLEDLVAGEAVRGRPLEVGRHGRARDARSCQILYVAPGEEPEDLWSVPGVGEGRVLTVGESEEFLRAGGLIRYRLVGGRIRLQVNDPARVASRLRISSKLLQLCDLVTPARARRGE
jgi:hypothetical protein